MEEKLQNFGSIFVQLHLNMNTNTIENTETLKYLKT